MRLLWRAQIFLIKSRELSPPPWLFLRLVYLIYLKYFLFCLGVSNDGESKGTPMPDLVPRTNPDPVAMNEATAQLYLECRQVCYKLYSLFISECE